MHIDRDRSERPKRASSWGRYVVMFAFFALAICVVSTFVAASFIL